MDYSASFCSLDLDLQSRNRIDIFPGFPGFPDFPGYTSCAELSRHVQLRDRFSLAEVVEAVSQLNAHGFLEMMEMST